MPGPPIPNGSRPAWTGVSGTWPDNFAIPAFGPRGIGVTRAAERALSTRTLQDLARAADGLGLVDHRARRRLRASGQVVRAAPNGCWTSSRAIRRSGAAASLLRHLRRRTTASTTVPPPARPRNDGAQSGGLSAWSWTANTTTRTGPSAGTPDDRRPARPLRHGAACHAGGVALGRGGWVNAQVFDHTR